MAARAPRHPGRHPLPALAALVLVATFIPGCGDLAERLTRRPRAQLPPPPDSVVFLTDTLWARAAREAARESALVVHYRPYVVGNTHAIWRLRLAIGQQRLASTLRVSRIDLQHVAKGDTLVIPDKTDSLLLSPYPAEIPAARPFRKLLLVSLRVQAFGAYEHGRLARWGPTSTGRQDKPTPAGLYFANWKAKERTSTIDDDWVLKWAVNLDSEQGIALHEYGLPGRPASHSCVRLAEEDAVWMYRWVDSWRVVRRSVTKRGTPVLVFGGYAYGRRRPWMRLVQQPDATRLSYQELDEAVADYLFAGPPAPDWLRATPVPGPPPPPEPDEPPVVADRAPRHLDSHR